MTQTRTLILALVLAYSCPAFATSGWGEYAVSVGHYSIAGDDYSYSGVWLIGPTGMPKADPIIELTPVTNRLVGPPGYIMLNDFLLLRYRDPDPHSSIHDKKYFAIQHKDYGVIGPMTLAEVESLTQLDLNSYDWTTPSLPSPWGFVFALVILPAIVLLLSVALLAGIVRRVIRFRRSKALHRNEPIA
jgi:hypothetical protein